MMMQEELLTSTRTIDVSQQLPIEMLQTTKRATRIVAAAEVSKRSHQPC
jgi:hypothetical protein